MINWINVNYDFMPDYNTQVLVAYKATDDSDNYGIALGSLQYNQIKGDYWLVDFPLIGEIYFEEDYIVTHWFPYQDEFNYPEEYYGDSERL